MLPTNLLSQVGSALLIAFIPFRVLIADEFPKDIPLSQCVAGWNRMDDVLSQMECEAVESVTTTVDGQIMPPTTVSNWLLKRNRNMMVIEQSLTRNEQLKLVRNVGVRNDRYDFIASAPIGGTLVLREVDHSHSVFAKHFSASSVTTSPPMTWLRSGRCLFGKPLEEYISSPHFQMKEFKEINEPSATHVLDFSFAPPGPDTQTDTPLRSGIVKLDRGHDWRIASYDVTLFWGHATGMVDYDDSHKVSRVSSVSRRIVAPQKNYELVETFKVTQFRNRELPAFDFSLAAYGFPEIQREQQHSLINVGTIALGLGLILLVGYVLTKRFGRR